MQHEFQIPSPLQELEHELFKLAGIKVFVKRDDLIHPIISGNKWRKLKFHIEDFKKSGQTQIASLGGPWSNHLHALAYYCYTENIPFTAVIKSYNGIVLQNECIDDLNRFRARLIFADKLQVENLSNTLQLDHYWINEGGQSDLGVCGVMELKNEFDFEPDYLLIAAGTGTTFKGLAKAFSSETCILLFPAIKAGIEELNAFFLGDLSDIEKNKVKIVDQYPFGGFGKQSKSLEEYRSQVFNWWNIEVDPVYNAKLIWNFMELVKEGYFKKGSTVVWIQTGGNQGAR